ncbi:MAG TPA: hypothetical protein VEE82_01905, partial [Thermodesulfovibrionales bacterium]|nr:hypothetical protein [Thermodesulfovibrionales bacterium]
MKDMSEDTATMTRHENTWLRCPYSGVSDICDASLSAILPSANSRLTLCKSEDYDSCPLFLS